MSILFYLLLCVFFFTDFVDVNKILQYCLLHICISYTFLISYITVMLILRNICSETFNIYHTCIFLSHVKIMMCVSLPSETVVTYTFKLYIYMFLYCQ
jgi:hypothetical protein